jgi:hypothetical protein
MGKRGALRRLPGEEPDFPDLMTRRYRAPLGAFKLGDVDVAAIRKRLGFATRAILRAKIASREGDRVTGQTIPRSR